MDVDIDSAREDRKNLRDRGLAAVVRAGLKCCPSARNLCKNARYLAYAIRTGLWRAMVRTQGNRRGQSVLDWTIPPVERPSGLLAKLRGNGLRVIDAEHALYLPPQAELAETFPEIVHFYPHNSGFKILKDFRHPRTANYLASRPGSAFVRRRLTGSLAEQVLTANYLHHLGLGPRVWDLCCWKGAGNEFSVFVVDHVEGDIPSPDECEQFLDQLKTHLRDSHLRILIANWQRQDDFECPACRGNLFRDRENRLQYVDFQNFRLRNPVKWSQEILDARTRRGLSFPEPVSRAESDKFWPLALQEVAKAGLDVSGRVVMQFGCGLGHGLSAALAGGAMWTLGWEQAELADLAEQYLFSLGASRFTLTAADPIATVRLAEAIPTHVTNRLDDAILLHEIAERDSPWFDAARGMPWRAMVCWGTVGMTTAELTSRLDVVTAAGGQPVATALIEDKNLRPRPVAILTRG